MERAQCLRQDGERGGGDERAPDVAEPAEHHEHQHEDGEVEVELRRLKRRVVQAVERACRARKGGGGDERHELVLRQVQADGLRGDAVVADGHDRAARTRTSQVQHDDERDHHEDEACGERCDRGGAGRALRALDDGRAVRTQAEVIDRFVAGEIENEVQALFIAANDEAVDKLLDDLAKGERHDGEIVALQAEHGRADEKADERGEKRADEHREREAHGAIRNESRKALRDDDTGERAYAHKARVAEAQLTEDTDRQVQRHGHGHVAADGDEQTDGGALERTVVLQDRRDDKDDDHAEIGRKVDLCGLLERVEFVHFLCHSGHLTLSPSRTCREVRQA